MLARPIAQKMNETWGQPVIVDNRTGAAGNIGSGVVAKVPPDGYTLLLGTIGTNAINAALYSKMPYKCTHGISRRSPSWPARICCW